jgi:hypothetical protein
MPSLIGAALLPAAETLSDLGRSGPLDGRVAGEQGILEDGELRPYDPPRRRGSGIIRSGGDVRNLDLALAHVPEP